MWSLLTRNRSQKSNRSRALSRPFAGRRPSVRLSLEELETRFCPSGFSLDSFDVEVANVGRQVLLHGDTSGSNGFDTIYFSGKVTGTATTDEFGHFEVVETATGLGTVSAYAYSDEYGTSNTLDATFFDPAPTIDILRVDYGSQMDRTVTITGSVTAAQAAGLTVNFGGVLSGAVVTDANGNFTFTGNASSAGDTTIRTTDVWGQLSNLEQNYLGGILPGISDFQVTKNSYGQWVASGTVSGGVVAGMTVNIGGLTTASATVNADGTFSVVLNLAGNATGTLTAVTTNGWGLSSNTASYFI